MLPAAIWEPATTRYVIGGRSGGLVPFQIAVHDGEEDLEEEVDRIYDDGKEE